MDIISTRKFNQNGTIGFLIPAKLAKENGIVSEMQYEVTFDENCIKFDRLMGE